MTGSELKRLREDLGEAIGCALSAADMAKLCGLPAESADTVRRWEVTGPSGPASELLRILAMASDHYPILENFNVIDHYNVLEQDRPARREAFRDRVALGGLVRGVDYVQALRRRRALCAEMAAAMADLDILVTAAQPAEAPRIADVPKWGLAIATLPLSGSRHVLG